MRIKAAMSWIWSFRIRFSRCLLTVRGLIFSFFPISLLVNPAAMRRSTSISRLPSVAAMMGKRIH